ncbi:hypothetical protein HNR05_002400 [Leifsonia psychrotolerans]|uniref:Uncharacterized protein n=1 Tax=Glaciibacter psychrotolerans TaxID=670054 RepID=A0A7Z0EGR8_9MICO|nr:hypothetical protein [Leifsonia psychrotolerans]
MSPPWSMPRIAWSVLAAIAGLSLNLFAAVEGLAR